MDCFLSPRRCARTRRKHILILTIGLGECVTLPILQRRQLRLRESEGMFTRVSSGWGSQEKRLRYHPQPCTPGWPTSANQMSSCPQRTGGNRKRRVKRRGCGRQRACWMQTLSAEMPQLIRWRLVQAGSRRERPEMASFLHNTQQLTLLCTSALQKHENCSFGGKQFKCWFRAAKSPLAL